MEMEKKKKDYEAPDIKVTQVEIESSICSGSQDVKFTGEGQAEVNIADQEVAGVTNNDFFGNSSWEIPSNSTTTGN